MSAFLVIEENKKYLVNPKKGIRVTEYLNHVGVVLDCNEHFVLWTDKLKEENGKLYIDYSEPRVLTMEEYREIAKYGEVISTVRDWSTKYWERVEGGVYPHVELPTEPKVEPKVEAVRAAKPKVHFMHEMHTEEKSQWYIELPNGTFVDVELDGDKYVIFVRDKEGREGLETI